MKGFFVLNIPRNWGVLLSLASCPQEAVAVHDGSTVTTCRLALINCY